MLGLHGLGDLAHLDDGPPPPLPDDAWPKRQLGNKWERPREDTQMKERLSMLMLRGDQVGDAIARDEEASFSSVATSAGCRNLHRGLRGVCRETAAYEEKW